MADFFAQNYVIIVIVAGMLMLGAVTGVFGVFTVLKRQALAGDALSHAALPGVVLAYIVTKGRAMPVLLLGAALAAAAAMLLLGIIKRFSNVKNDAGLALILSAFFGIGQLLLKSAQESGGAAAAGLGSFIFGQTATMLLSDVLFIAAVSAAVLTVIALFWKEFKLITFDGDFFQSLGFPRRATEAVMTTLTVIVVVISIRAVGVILMSALLISPAVAARQWSNKLSVNVLLAGTFGMASGTAGTLISAAKSNLPTGPVIVVALSIILLISMLFAPKRGMIKSAAAAFKRRRDLYLDNVLVQLYIHGAQHEENAKDFFAGKLCYKDMSALIRRSYLKRRNGSAVLTGRGIRRARRVIARGGGQSDGN